MSYFPETWQKAASLKKMRAALASLGMPIYLLKAAPSSGTGLCVDGDFAPTPAALAGAEVVSSERLVDLKQHEPQLLIIDVGRGTSIVDGAVWRNPALTEKTPEQFALAEAFNKAGPDRRTRIVVGGDGPSGCASYNAVRTLTAHGFQKCILAPHGRRGLVILQTAACLRYRRRQGQIR